MYYDLGYMDLPYAFIFSFRIPYWFVCCSLLADLISSRDITLHKGPQYVFMAWYLVKHRDSFTFFTFM
jgi:hypothetical protein